MATATAQDIKDHADSIFAAAASVVAAKVDALPNKYLKDMLGQRLVDEMQLAIREAAGSEDFSDLDADLA